MLLSTLFVRVAVMTNILSNAATAVLFTPMGYQTNLLVMGPGHYKFSDYLRGGAPLAVLIWLAFSCSRRGIMDSERNLANIAP